MARDLRDTLGLQSRHREYNLPMLKGVAQWHRSVFVDTRVTLTVFSRMQAQRHLQGQGALGPNLDCRVTPRPVDCGPRGRLNWVHETLLHVDKGAAFAETKAGT